MREPIDSNALPLVPIRCPLSIEVYVEETRAFHGSERECRNSVFYMALGGQGGYPSATQSYTTVYKTEQIRKLITSHTSLSVITINATFHCVHTFSIWHSFTHDACTITQLPIYNYMKLNTRISFYGCTVESTLTSSTVQPPKHSKGQDSDVTSVRIQEVAITSY